MANHQYPRPISAHSVPCCTLCIIHYETTSLPVNHARPVQVLDSQHQLPDVLLGLPLVQALLVVDAVHQVAAGAQLHHQVVAVLRLQDVEQLRDVGVADHLLDVALAPQVLGHIRVLLRLPLVNHLHRHLEE